MKTINTFLSRAPLFCILLLVAEIVLGIMHIMWAEIFPIHHSLTRFFNLHEEGNLPTWFSSIQLVAVGFMLLIISMNQRDKKTTFALALGGLGFLFLSADEAAQIHERIGTMIDSFIVPRESSETVTWTMRQRSVFHKTGYWMFFLLPIFLGLAWFGWTQVKSVFGTGRTSKMMIFGVLFFAGSATIPETVSNFITWNPFVIAEVVVEEIGEMMGITFVIWGLYDFLRNEKITLRFE